MFVRGMDYSHGHDVFLFFMAGHPSEVVTTRERGDYLRASPAFEGKHSSASVRRFAKEHKGNVGGTRSSSRASLHNSRCHAKQCPCLVTGSFSTNNINIVSHKSTIMDPFG